MSLSDSADAEKRGAPKVNSQENGTGAFADNLNGMSEEISGELKRLVPDPAKQNQLVSVIRRVVERNYSGPIPHPEHFAGYESVLPGAAGRIIEMAEAENAHRHQWEMQALRYEAFTNILGQVLGFLVSAGLIAAALYCAIIGERAVAGIFLGVGTLGFVKALIPWHRNNDTTAATTVPKPASRKNKK
jgi:uncharacterized membrane protein